MKGQHAFTAGRRFHVRPVSTLVLMILVGVALILFLWRTAAAEDSLTLKRFEHPLLREATSGEATHYVLWSKGRDIAMISLAEDGSVGQMLFMNQANKRTVTLSSGPGGFPAAMDVSVFESSVLDSFPQLTVMDDDLDGKADRLMDWQTRTMFVLEEIRWKPAAQKHQPRSPYDSIHRFIREQIAVLKQALEQPHTATQPDRETASRPAD